MCELTEPAPGFVFSLSNAILGVIGTPILATVVWLYLRFAGPPDPTFRGILFRIDPPNSYASRRRRVSQTTVQVIGVIATFCAGIAISIIASCAFPTDSARRLWLMREESQLSPACVTQVVDPANAAALGLGGGLFLGIFLLWCVAVGLFAFVASERRRTED
jgi:hypothetical protein